MPGLHYMVTYEAAYLPRGRPPNTSARAGAKFQQQVGIAQQQDVRTHTWPQMSVLVRPASAAAAASADANCTTPWRASDCRRTKSTAP